MIKILTVVGARPQFIKAAALSRIFKSMPGVEEVLIHTGQHYDESLSAVFFEELEIPKPRRNLKVGSGRHGEQTALMLHGLEEVLLAESPDVVLVYGDTNSTLAGALAAAKLHIPVAHVEAGLRSFNRRMPEEINRVLTDHCAELLFVPTVIARDNLLREGVESYKIHLVGDVMLDIARHAGKDAGANLRVVEKLKLAPKNYILASVHRAENTDSQERLCAIFKAFSEISRRVPVLLPLHPRTREALAAFQLDSVSESFQLIDPLGYRDMAALEANASLIATDSGGVQKEAYFYGVPCVTLRDETEWLELVNEGWNTVVPPREAKSIVQALERSLENKVRPPFNNNLYGDGSAAKVIAATLLTRYSAQDREHAVRQ